MANLVEFDPGGIPRKPFDPSRLLRELEAKFKLAQDPHERAILADWIVPEYITYVDAQTAREYLDRVAESDDPEVTVRMETLRGIVAAMEGDDPQSHLEKALKLLGTVAPATVAVVQHRAGLAHFFARHPHAAEKHALQALWRADAEGLRRLAARAASVLYAVHYHLTGDLQAARYYAEVASVEAAAAGDAMVRRQFLIAQFDLAVVFAEWDRARSLLEMLRRDRWYDTYSGSIVAQIGVIVLHGHAGAFTAMLGAADALLESSDEGADYALAHALRALALAASGADQEAGKAARQALSLSSEHRATEYANHATRRRLAATLAAYICVLIGDTHRGSRALESRCKWPGEIGAFARALMASLHGGAIDVENPDLQGVRGFLELGNSVRRIRFDRVQRIPERVRTLTHTELTVLRATATGKTNAEIARERGVTRNAVERRLMSAYEKLGVKNRTEAIAKLAEI